MEIAFTIEPELSTSEFVNVLHRSTLADRRPVDSEHCITGMLSNADIIVAARTPKGLLVGVSRAISDFHFCTYLSDLAVDCSFQRQGIGKRLIDKTHEIAGRSTLLILLSAPEASSYYPHVGMEQHNSCWILLPSNEFPNK